MYDFSDLRVQQSIYVSRGEELDRSFVFEANGLLMSAPYNMAIDSVINLAADIGNGMFSNPYIECLKSIYFDINADPYGGLMPDGDRFGFDVTFKNVFNNFALRKTNIWVTIDYHNRQLKNLSDHMVTEPNNHGRVGGFIYKVKDVKIAERLLGVMPSKPVLLSIENKNQDTNTVTNQLSMLYVDGDRIKAYNMLDERSFNQSRGIPMEIIKETKQESAAPKESATKDTKGKRRGGKACPKKNKS